jgi:NAD+ kinase
MNKQPTIPGSAAILAHPSLPKAVQEMTKVEQYLVKKGLKVQAGLLNDEPLRRRIRQAEFDLVIVLGGDGAMLHAGRICADADIPLLGINFGRFGFLIDVQHSSWKSSLKRLLAGDFRFESRMMLCAELWRGKNKIQDWEVLNEVVVCRGQLVKPLQLSAYIDGNLLTTYVADGLIAATPTGSTAYALAAGGPIMPPELRNILLVPVAPHLSVDQAIILPEGSHVSISVISSHPAVLSVDGQDPVLIQKGDRVDVSTGHFSVRFVRFQDPDYFYKNLMYHMEQNPITGIHR